MSTKVFVFASILLIVGFFLYQKKFKHLPRNARKEKILAPKPQQTTAVPETKVSEPQETTTENTATESRPVESSESYSSQVSAPSSMPAPSTGSDKFATSNVPDYVPPSINLPSPPPYFPDLDSMGSSERVNTFKKIVTYYKTELDEIYRYRPLMEHDATKDKVTELAFEAQELLMDPSNFDGKYPKDPGYVKEIRDFVNEVKTLQRKGNIRNEQYQKIQSRRDSTN